MAVGTIGKLDMVQRLSPLEAQRHRQGDRTGSRISRSTGHAVGRTLGLPAPSAKNNARYLSAAFLRPPCCQIRQPGRAFTAQTLLPIVIEEEFNIAPAPLIARESVTTLFNRIYPAGAPTRLTAHAHHDGQLPERSVHGSRNPY
jgi:hypothetical protein